MENIVKNIHDERIKRRKDSDNKSDKDIKDIQIIDVERMKLVSLFEKVPLHTYNLTEDCRNSKYDVHVLLIGFDKLGKQAVYHILNNGILSKDSDITIDIVVGNKSVEEEKFNNILADSYSAIEKINPLLDGNVFIQFHEQLNITRDFIHGIHGHKPITYVIISTGSIDQNLTALFNINSVLLNKTIPIAVALDDSGDISEYFSENQELFKDVNVIPSEKEVLKLSMISNKELEKEQREYNSLHNQITKNLKKIVLGDACEEILWEELVFEKKESNKYCHEHTSTKLEIVKELCKSNSGKDAFTFLQERFNKCLQGNLNELIRIEDETGSQQLQNIGVKAILEGIKSDNYLTELLALEHRRWCYLTILNGWERSEGKKKDEERKQTPYLGTFQQLLEDGIKEQSKTACNDMIPYLKMLHDNVCR